MPAITAGIGVGSSILSGFLGSSAASKAAGEEQAAERSVLASNAGAKSQALSTLGNVYTNEQAAENPYQAAGSEAVAKMNGAVLGANGNLTADQVLANDPGYQFRLEEGAKALQRAEAAGGGVGSGGALKAAAQYGQNYASGEYAAAIQRILASQQQRFSQLSNIAGIGENANAHMLAAGSEYGSASSNVDMDTARRDGSALEGIGNAQAAGTMGAANAWSSALSGVGKAASGYTALKSLPPTSSGYVNDGSDMTPAVSLGDLMGRKK